MTWRTKGLAAALVLCAAGFGCGGSTAGGQGAANASGASTAEGDEVAAGLMEHHQHHHHGGVTLLIALSLDTLGGVSPDQRDAVEKFATELRDQMEPARRAEQDLHTLLADGIAAGAIDHAKVEAAVARVQAAAGSVRDASVDVLNRLHAVLTPAQRAALADKVEAHWDVWQRANAEEPNGTPDQPRKSGHLERLVRELGLSQDQIVMIHAKLAGTPPPPFDPQVVANHIRAFGEAFRADVFDARAIPGGGADTELTAFGAARVARFYEAVDPVLTGEQRAKLAEILREHASYARAGGG
jgi:Spy/CpxP family protein refolding chaperone